MSRYYRMMITVRGFDPKKKDLIEEAVCALWNIEDDYGSVQEGNVYHEWCGESNLGGGVSENEFAREVRDAVWKANGAFCEIEVAAAYLDDPPTECYVFDEEDYAEYTGEGEEEA